MMNRSKLVNLALEAIKNNDREVWIVREQLTTIEWPFR